jgi:hypothetical protein
MPSVYGVKSARKATTPATSFFNSFKKASQH